MRRLVVVLMAVAVVTAFTASTALGAGAVPKAASNGTLLIGQMVSETSALSPGTKNTAAGDTLAAWAKMVNAQGGINGRKVEIKKLDDGGDPAKASANMKDLVSDGVVAVVAMSASATVSQWLPIAAAAGIPVVGGSCYDPRQPNDENSFCVTTVSILDGLKAQVKWAADNGAKSFGITYSSDSPQASAAADLFASLTRQAGLTWTSATGMSTSQPDYTAGCVLFKQANTTDVGIEGGPDMQRMTKDCARQNYYPQWTSGDWQIAQNSWMNDPNIKTAIAALYEFPYVLTKGDTPEQTASLKQFHRAMQKYAPKVLTGDFKQYSAVWWTAALAFGAAAKKIPAGTAPTAAMVKDGLYSFQGETLGGLAPQPLTFTKGQAHPHISCWWGMVLKNHKLTVPNGMKTTCTP